ncbi:MAG: T9SS type A sorting domain-containing protein [Proteobacteria bacterium]|nr:T9SS type A sorting domain-containing protein [Pseudomonadota bacterium]
MKKLLFFLLILPVFLFGFTNLKINDSTSPSLSVNNSLKITGNFQGGDTCATIKFYYDVNQNLTLDSEDKLVMFYKIYDGSPYDSDEVKNTYYSGYIPEIPVPMYAFVVGVDNGGADTIPLSVNPLSSSTVTLSGTVAAGGNPAEKVLVLGCNDNCYGAFTGTDGSYNINFPDSLIGDTFHILVLDMLGNKTGYLGCVDSLVLLGDDTMNFQMTLSDSTMLSGRIIDNLGDTLKDTVDWFIGGGYLSGSTIKAVTAQTFITDGSYSMPIIKGSYFSQWDVDYGFPTAMYYPEYTERRDTSFAVSGNTNFNILLFKNDATIKGHVYVNGAGVDAFKVQCSATTDTIVGDMKTITYSDGRYTLPVSTASDSYNVFIIVPDGYSCATSLISAACGDTGIDFNLTQTGIEEKNDVKQYNVSVKFINGKLFVSGDKGRSGSIALYDIIGRKLFSENMPSEDKTFDLNLERGVYFAIIKNGDAITRKKLINLR